MAAFWKLEDLAKGKGTVRVEHGVLLGARVMFPLSDVARADIRAVGSPRRRMPGGWTGQAAGVVLLVALAWACFVLFEVLEPVYWIGPALLSLAALVLLSFGALGAKCPPFACLEIEKGGGYKVRIFVENKNGELDRLLAAVHRGRADAEYEFSEEMDLLSTAHEFCDIAGPSEKVDELP